MLVLGLMSGTSADGIYVALARISGTPPHLNAKLLGHTSFQFPPALRKEILRVAEQQPIPAGELSQLNFRLGHVYADAILAACKKFKISPKRIGLIGNHGQTIFHQGQPSKYFGLPTASTLQIGEGSIIATCTGITTVSDFRPADMALGGQGAPLVPYVDYLLYRHPQLGRVSLNIGGIANVTVIPAGARPHQVFAFDTGPGNMLIDALVQHFTHGRQRFDKDARLARRSRINRQLLKVLLQDPYLKRKPPKSTGREYFGATYVRKLLALGRRYEAKPNDLIHTATAFTAASIADALHRFVLPKHKIHQIIVSGGGAQNPLLYEQLSVFAMVPPRAVYSPARPKKVFVEMRLSSPTGSFPPQTKQVSFLSVLPSSRFGIPTDAKEAFAFALLAYETFHQRPANLPSATGARGPAILGKISYAPPR
ncbi:MAG: anhydro-N-acetylmuramic acid kinase [Acidobacteria bacterium]|nr:MAG: anhydro-N-acetylmuramic acid kinase [Acidobacteriota bacterium]